MATKKKVLPQVDLTWEQVQQEFPKAAKEFQRNYDENAACLAEEESEEFVGDQLLPPEKCQYYLAAVDVPPYGRLKTRPGYRLYAFDQAAVACISGGGTTMMWTGQGWEA